MEERASWIRIERRKEVSFGRDCRMRDRILSGIIGVVRIVEAMRQEVLNASPLLRKKTG